MPKNPQPVAVLMFVLLAIASCARDGTTPGESPSLPPVTSESESPSQSVAQAGNQEGMGHYLWGYFLVLVDPTVPRVEIIPVRDAVSHMNVLQFLEQWPCANCLKIAGIQAGPDGTILVDISIKHPFANPNLTGFDVRGITMFNGSHQFPASGLILSDHSLGDGELVNADGYTTLYNPTTAGHGMEGYIKGKLSTVAVPNATLNGYKRFITDNPENWRNAFYAGDTIVVTYQIKMPIGPFVFGYAIDASWAPPINKPVVDPMTDFGLEANCAEAWKISVSDSPISAGLTDCGGSAKLTIDVYDWQGKDNAHPVVVECPELFDGTVEAAEMDEGTGFTSYEAIVENVKLAPAGEYLCLVGKEAAENDPSKPWLNLTAYRIHSLEVTAVEKFPPVALAKANYYTEQPGQPIEFTDDGSYDQDCGALVKYEWDWDNDGTYDEEGSAVSHSWSVVGTYYVQFRVTDDDGHTDELDTPLKINIKDDFGWARTWGDYPYSEKWASGTAVDNEGNVYLTGFEPTSQAFLAKFDAWGHAVWTRKWGSEDTFSHGASVKTDGAGNVYVAGPFGGTIDFDPGPGVDEHSAYDAWVSIFLSKFDSEGNFQWARTWGGVQYPASEIPVGLGCDVNGNTFVTGPFGVGDSSQFDFDPGPGLDEHPSNGYIDVFLSKFNTDGIFQWARTWGSSGNYSTFGEYGADSVTDGLGNVYVVGMVEECDLDPGPDVDNHSWGPFLSKFDNDGNYLWGHTWPEDQSAPCYVTGVALADPSAVFVSASVESMGYDVDFEPGPGIDLKSLPGQTSAYVSKFDSESNYQWTQIWGGVDGRCTASGIATDPDGNLCIAGRGYGIIDFDPGEGTDNHLTYGWCAFLNKLDPDGNYQYVRTWSGPTNDDYANGSGVAADLSGSIYTAGTFSGIIDFDPGPDVENHQATNCGIFLVKILADGYW